MKKQNLIAMVGVVALMANLILPGLAFGQTEETKQGTAQILCGQDTPSFAMIEAGTQALDDFDFLVDGSTPITQEATEYTDTFSNNDNNDPDGKKERMVVVYDPRDPREAGCNDGITIDVRPVNPDANGHYFKHATDDTYYIPTATPDGNSRLWVGTSNLWAPTNFTANSAGTVLYGSGALYATCATVGDTCTSATPTASDLGDTTGLSNQSTYLSSGEFLAGYSAGNETQAIATVLDHTGADAGFLGYMAVNLHFAQQIPPLQSPGSYTVDLLVTLLNP